MKDKKYMKEALRLIGDTIHFVALLVWIVALVTTPLPPIALLVGTLFNVGMLINEL